MIFAVRFFTPNREAPFVGHATIAAQYVLAKTRGAQKAEVTAVTGAGVIEVDVLKAGRRTFGIALTQSPPSLGPLFPIHHRRQYSKRSAFPARVLQQMHPSK